MPKCKRCKGENNRKVRRTQQLDHYRWQFSQPGSSVQSLRHTWGVQHPLRVKTEKTGTLTSLPLSSLDLQRTCLAVPTLVISSVWNALAPVFTRFTPSSPLSLSSKHFSSMRSALIFNSATFWHTLHPLKLQCLFLISKAIITFQITSS